MTNPYFSQPPQCFWNSGVKRQSWSALADIYTKKFEITPKTRIFTAGSCFAQHVGRRLRKHEFAIIDAEPAPRGLRGERGARYGFGAFSARFGNIYTIRQLIELIKEATGRLDRPVLVWPKADKFVDGMRPGVEPDGLATPEEVVAQRRRHLICVRRALTVTDVMVFTFGLTEAWIHKASGTVVPIVPGTSAGGVFVADEYEFHNFTFNEIYGDFLRVRHVMRRVNPNAKFLLTVSPVPLAATATKDHVLTATGYSKSVLRAVCGQLAADYEDIAYFPSYELITAPFSQEFFYDDDHWREIRPEAVDMVMQVFFRAHAPELRFKVPIVRRDSQNREDAVCEERLLEAFAK